MAKQLGVEYTHSHNLAFRELFGHAEDLIEGERETERDRKRKR